MAELIIHPDLTINLVTQTSLIDLVRGRMKNNPNKRNKQNSPLSKISQKFILKKGREKNFSENVFKRRIDDRYLMDMHVELTKQPIETVQQKSDRSMRRYIYQLLGCVEKYKEARCAW